MGSPSIGQTGPEENILESEMKAIENIARILVGALGIFPDLAVKQAVDMVEKFTDVRFTPATYTALITKLKLEQEEEEKRVKQ